MIRSRGDDSEEKGKGPLGNDVQVRESKEDLVDLELPELVFGSQVESRTEVGHDGRRLRKETRTMLEDGARVVIDLTI
jgi:hypothetical protein